MPADVLTACPNCGKSTSSIRGRCPNCAFLKDPAASPGPPARKLRSGSLWDDLDDVLLVGLWLAPVAVLLALGLIFSLDVLLILAVAVFVIPLGIRALADWP